MLKFRYYLMGAKFVIMTDYQGLTFIRSITYLNSRLLRWSLYLQQISFAVAYCPGKDNIIANCLSRNPDGKFKEEKTDVIKMASLHQFIYPQITNDIDSLLLMALNSDNADVKQIFKILEHKQKDDLQIKKGSNLQ